MYPLKKTILVIEDESDLRELLDEELSAAGFRVVTAGDGLEGLAKIQDTEPDLVICDRAMPAMTGYELLDRLRGVYPQYRDMPFIFLTALTDARDRESVRHLSPAAYLEKPLDFETLIQTVQKLVGQGV